MNINVNNQNTTQVIIDIEGVIGMDESVQFATESSTPRVSTFQKFKAEIDKIDTDVVESLRLNIRSMGGEVHDALLMHSALVELAQKITIETHCYGFSASAATIIAQAASPSKRYVAGSAMYMIHRASMHFDGNTNTAESAAELLAKTDQQIAQIYALRSGLLPEHFIEVMNRDNGKGEWLTAQEAVEMGLADRLESAVSIKNVMNNIGEFFRKIFQPESTLSPAHAQESEGVQARNQEVVAQEQPTKTMAKEDPVIEHYSVQLSGNKSAYSRDVELFRGR